VKATKVNAGPAESNGRLLLGIWRDSLHVTCGLTACTPRSARGPTLGNEYGKTLPFHRATAPQSRRTRHASWSDQQAAQCSAGQQPAGRRGSGYLGGQGGRRSRGRTAQTLNTARRNPGRLDHGCLCMPDRHSRARVVVYSIRYEMLF